MTEQRLWKDNDICQTSATPPKTRNSPGNGHKPTSRGAFGQVQKKFQTKQGFPENSGETWKSQSTTRDSASLSTAAVNNGNGSFKVFLSKLPPKKQDAVFEAKADILEKRGKSNGSRTIGVLRYVPPSPRNPLSFFRSLLTKSQDPEK